MPINGHNTYIKGNVHVNLLISCLELIVITNNS